MYPNPNEDRTLSQRAVGISEIEKLKETVRLLAGLWEAAQRLPEGLDRQDALDQIGGFQRRVEAFIRRSIHESQAA
jgi:hypothetical protein